MSSDSSKKIINQFKALNSAEKTNIRKEVKAEQPFADFIKMAKNDVGKTRNIATNTPKSLPSLNKIAKQINDFKFNIDDEINNIY